MMPADVRSFEESEEDVEGGGLLGGLTVYHLRVLCENPWEGGGGYDVRDVARWTLDQVWFRLCKMEVLKMGAGRKEKMSPSAVESDENGLIKGRAEDGTPIAARVTGKSVARRLMEEEQRKREEEEKARKWRERRAKRRKRRGT